LNAGSVADPARGRSPRRGPWRRRSIVLLVLLVLLAEAWLFLLPATTAPERADAIVVFAGPGDRIGKAWELADDGFAPVVVVSTDDVGRCTPERSTVEQICFTPDPATTRGEAERIAQIARSHGWRDLLVVSSTTQARRAALRLDRCFTGGFRVVTVGEPFVQTLYRWVYEHGAIPKALLLQRSC